MNRHIRQQPNHSCKANMPYCKLFRACVCEQAKRYQAARCALGVALKHKAQSWQVLDNYSLAAAKSGDPHSAARAMLQTINLSKGERVHADVLSLLVDAVASGRNASEASSSGIAEDDKDECASHRSELRAELDLSCARVCCKQTVQVPLDATDRIFGVIHTNNSAFYPISYTEILSVAPSGACTGRA